ncbi:MAG: fibronectin type III domain-containing protein [Cytophagales bacterium]|nr:MAG: fibronectin type III domain-containing protein [Cytophagales bacterium]
MKPHFTHLSLTLLFFWVTTGLANGQTCSGAYLLGAGNILSTSAEFWWNCNEQYAQFSLEYKPTTTATWSSLNDIQSDNDGYGRDYGQRITLTNLIPNTTYQWRVRTICTNGNSSTFVAGTNFTTVCPGVVNPFSFNILSTSVELGWGCAEQYAQFTLEYKPTTATTWSSLSAIQSDYEGYGRDNERVTLTNLIPNTTYQWRIRTICASGNPSDPIPGRNFTTACPGVVNPFSFNILSTSVELGWGCAEQYAQFTLEISMDMGVTIREWS